MGYYLVFEENGETRELGPIACDNPKSPHGYEDKSILRKTTAWANRLANFDGLKYYCEHRV